MDFTTIIATVVGFYIFGVFFGFQFKAFKRMTESMF